MTIGRNDPCPCGQLKKYKKCCSGKVPWEDLLRNRVHSIPLHLSARGKNMAFLAVLADALQIDSITPDHSWADIKRACTPAAVKKIHEAIPELWPSGADLQRVLDAERENVSGLYIGNYSPEGIFRGLARHAIYSDRILLFDPFLDPRVVRSENNPVENPDVHRMATLQWIRLWWGLIPWIGAGMVQFIRRPEDFDLHLAREALSVQKRKYENNPAFVQSINESVASERDSTDARQLREVLMLSEHDPNLVAKYLEHNPGADQFEIEEFMKDIQRMRDDHPYFVELPETGKSRSLVMSSTGTNYYIAKIVAASIGAHLITDIPSRWKEVELDRDENGLELGPWTSFAKAFQAAPLRVLNNVPLTAVLALREERRLERMRGFLRKAWRTSRSDDELAADNAVALADELQDTIAEAEHEWQKIDQELVKWFGVETGTALAALPNVPSGSVGWLAGGWLLGGLGTYGVAWYQRRNFQKRYPAAFFLSLAKGK